MVCEIDKNKAYTKLTSGFYDSQTDTFYGVFYNDTVLFNKTAVCWFRVADLNPMITEAVQDCLHNGNTLAQACLKFNVFDRECQCKYTKPETNSYTIALKNSFQIKSPDDFLLFNMRILEIYKITINQWAYLVVSTTHRKLVFLQLNSSRKPTQDFYEIDLNGMTNRK
jgi:hypothetical protein